MTKEKKEIKYKDITTEDIIEYAPLHPSFGRAEFLICPVFKYGKLKEVFISALQQERKDGRHWRLVLPEGAWNTFSIESWTHLTDPPNIWREAWCKEHKAIMHEVSVPNNTCKIEFRLQLGNALSIKFVGNDAQKGKRK